MKNFWIVVVSVIRSLFNNEIHTPRRVKGRCARVENLENRLALSASLPASDVALIREAFLEENVASLMGEYGSSSAGTMSAIDLSALIETAILDEDGALFDEGYEQTEFESTTPVNLSVNNEEFTTSALEVGATNAYADLIAEAESLEIEDVSETPLSELDFKGNLDAEMEYYFDISTT